MRELLQKINRLLPIAVLNTEDIRVLNIGIARLELVPSDSENEFHLKLWKEGYDGVLPLKITDENLVTKVRETFIRLLTKKENSAIKQYSRILDSILKSEKRKKS